MNDTPPMLSFIMTPVYKNRSREADNQSAKAAYEEGEKYKIIDQEKALIWYIQAANQGHSKAAFEAEKIRKKLNMKGSLYPEAHNRNLEETNKPIEKPKFTRPLSLHEKDGTQTVETIYHIKKPQVSNKQKSTTEKSATEQKKTEIGEVKKRAKAGDAEAQYLLGIRYLNLTYKWLQKSAEQKHEKANQQLIKLSTAPAHKTESSENKKNLNIWHAAYADPGADNMFKHPLLSIRSGQSQNVPAIILSNEPSAPADKAPPELPAQTIDAWPDYPVSALLTGIYDAEAAHRLSIRDIFNMILRYIRQKLRKPEDKPVALEELNPRQSSSTPTGSAIWSLETSDTQNT